MDPRPDRKGQARKQRRDTDFAGGDAQVIAEEAPVETQGEGQHRREPGEAIEGESPKNVPRKPSQVSVRTPTTQAMKRNSATLTGRFCSP